MTDPVRKILDRYRSENPSRSGLECFAQRVICRCTPRLRRRDVRRGFATPVAYKIYLGYAPREGLRPRIVRAKPGPKA